MMGHLDVAYMQNISAANDKNVEWCSYPVRYMMYRGCSNGIALMTSRL